MPTTPPNLVHMPLHIANDLGLFKKHGLSIKVIELAGGVYTFRAVVSGSADVASASGPFSIVGKAKGAPTKMILTNTPKLEASMVVNDNIKTMADLKGKRIGIQEPGGFADVLAQACCAPPRSTKGRAFCQHRDRGRAGAGRQPGRHRDPARRAGDDREEQDPDAARHRAALGDPARQSLRRDGGDGQDDQGQARRA